MSNLRKSPSQINKHVGLNSAATKHDDNVETQIGRNIVVRADGCWDYGKSKSYGRHNVVGTVHRYVYEILVGPIPEGHQLHHTCERKSCCNPYHLEPLTPSEHKLEHLALKR